MAQKGESDTEDRVGSQAALLRLCAALGLSGVACGALGAHAVKALGPAPLEWWETAARYHVLHALAVGLLAALRPRRAALVAGLFTAGVLLFSGSLYLLALTGARGLGLITPVGGVGLLAGWAALLLGARR